MNLGVGKSINFFFSKEHIVKNVLLTNFLNKTFQKEV